MPAEKEEQASSVVSKSAVGRVTSGVLANLLGQAINAFGQILLVPVFLGYWGKQRYGEWLTLSAAVTYLSMLDFGMQMYLVNRMNQCYTQGDYRGHTQVLHSAFLFSLLLSVTAVLLVTPIFLASPIESWFRFSSTNHATATVVAILLCVQIVGAIPYGLLSGCYRTIGEFPRGQMVSNVRTMSSLVLTVIVIMLGGGLISVAITQLVLLIATGIWVCLDLRSRHREIQIGFAHADLKLAVSFLGPSSLFFLIQAATALTVQGSVIMVGALFGAASVAVFVPLRTLANVIRQLASALHTALWPEITALEISKRHAKLRNIHLLGAKLLVVVSVCSGLFLHFMGPEIISAWTHRAHLYDSRLFDSFLILLVSQSPWLTAALILTASNNHRRLSICYAAAAIIGLGIGYVLAHRLGMAGLVTGLWIGESLVCGTLAPIMACRLMGESLRRFLLEILLRGAIFAVVLFVIVKWLLTVWTDGSSAIHLSVFGLAITLLGLILGYVVYFNAGERGQIRSLLGAARARDNKELFPPVMINKASE
jgi:O-antigen/teichoic acid export membrane protein